MRLAAAAVLAQYGGGGGEPGRSSFPAHGHPETPFGRRRQQKGPDRGGVQAKTNRTGYGYGYGKGVGSAPDVDPKFPGATKLPYGHRARSGRLKQGNDGFFWKHGRSHGGLSGQSAGTQTSGSSLLTNRYSVVDRHGSALHSGLPWQDALRRSAAVTYSRIVRDRGDVQQVRDVARKQLADKGQAKVGGRQFRRSMQFPDVDWTAVR